MGSLSPAQVSNDEEEEEEANPAEGMTMKDIMSFVRGRKRSGIPMPSSVKRREDQKKRRREEREEREGGVNADGDAEARADGAAGAADAQAPGAAAGGGDVAGSAAGGDVAAPPDRADGGPPVGGDAVTEDVAPASEEVPAVAEPVVVAPKVTVDENGNIVIDKDSLCISAGPGLGDDMSAAEVVTMDTNDHSRRVTSATYARRDSATKWTPEDTQKFFDSLSRFGTDFALIEHAFPKRSRRQIKLKYKREERDNPKKIDEYLKARPKAMTIADTRKTLNMHGDPTDPKGCAPAAEVEKSGDPAGKEDTENDKETLSSGIPALQAEAVNNDEDNDNDDVDGGERATPEQGSRSPNVEASQTLAATEAPAAPVASIDEEEDEEEQFVY